MKYLITGGCGFLGSNLASEVLKNGEDLLIFDNLLRVGSEQNLEWLKTLGKFQFMHGDIRNNDDVLRVTRNFKPDVVFHLAGQVAMTTSVDRPRMDFEINALGTLNVLEAVREYCPDATVLYSSTNKVYGDMEYIGYTEGETRYKCDGYPHGFDESLLLDFHYPYGCSKGAGDQYMLDYARAFGLKTVVFRHSSIYGGRQFSTSDQGWIGWFCLKALESKDGIREPFTISGNGKQVRDVLYSEDLKNLYFQTVKNIDTAKGNAFNIGGGMKQSLSLLELFEVLEAYIGCEMKYKELPWRESDQKVFVADIAKAKKLINWEPKIGMISGIQNMVDWVRESNEY